MEKQMTWRDVRQRLFKMVSVGVIDEPLNMAYDVFSTATLIINLCAAVLYTFDSVKAAYGPLLLKIEAVTVLLFAVDYFLRLITADFLYPPGRKPECYIKYILSAAGIIDLLSFLPYYLPVFFPAGVVAFRMIRVARILRLFRINAYYDSLNVITEVLNNKKQQLVSSVFIIMVLMLASSLCMYSLEHDAQPDVFKNAFSGIWWSVSTLLTVGYGDIYPVTTMGRIFGIVITFLGVGMVAIPTGIISAGFVEQYSRLKKLGDYAVEEDMHFIEIKLTRRDAWTGSQLKDIGLPQGVIIAAIIRKDDNLIPRGNIVLKVGDVIILGAESLKNDRPGQMKEIILRKNHLWNGQKIKDLDISRQTILVYVKRNGRMIIPKGDLVLCEGDAIILYSKIDKRSETDYI